MDCIVGCCCVQASVVMDGHGLVEWWMAGELDGALLVHRLYFVGTTSLTMSST